MKIEYKNRGYRKDIYQVGNVIENDGVVYLVCHSNECAKYFLINLYTAAVSSGMYESLKELAQAVGDKDDTLVKAKLIVDYKIDGGTEDEDTK